MDEGRVGLEVVVGVRDNEVGGGGRDERSGMERVKDEVKLMGFDD